MSRPLVVTYLPNYNYHQKGFLAEALRSLGDLTYPNLKLLLIDDGSTDGSQDIMSAFAAHDNRATFIAQPHRGIRWGQGWINMALRWAAEKGCEYFSILDSDDKIEPNYWESVLPFFSRPEIGFVRVGLWQFGEGDPKWMRPKMWNHVADILADNKVFVGSPFRIAMWKDVGDWDDGLSWSDWDFWARATIRRGWKWATCNEPLFWYRKHGAQLNASSRAEKQAELVEYMTNKYKDDLPNLPIVMKFGKHYDSKPNEVSASTDAPLWERFKHV